MDASRFLAYFVVRGLCLFHLFGCKNQDHRMAACKHVTCACAPGCIFGGMVLLTKSRHDPARGIELKSLTITRVSSTICFVCLEQHRLHLPAA